MANRTCKCGCGKSIDHKHPNAKFYNQKHKDKFHNWNNPRGKFAHLDKTNSEDILYEEDYDPSDSEYWDNKDY